MREWMVLCLLAGCTVNSPQDVPRAVGQGAVIVDPKSQTVTLDESRVPVLSGCEAGKVVCKTDAGWECADVSWESVVDKPSTLGGPALAGNGTATTAARSDHHHDATYLTLAEYDGYVAALGSQGTTNAGLNPVHWTKLKGVPAGFVDEVDNDTTYTTGQGLEFDPAVPNQIRLASNPQLAGDVGVGDDLFLSPGNFVGWSNTFGTDQGTRIQESSGDLLFITGGTERMRIRSVGSFGFWTPYGNPSQCCPPNVCNLVCSCNCLAAGWTNEGSSFYHVSHKKVGDLVYLRGAATTADASANLPVLTLPASHRPQKTMVFTVSSGATTRVVSIDTAGVVRRATAIAGTLNLDGITFSVDANVAPAGGIVIGGG